MRSAQAMLDAQAAEDILHEDYVVVYRARQLDGCPEDVAVYLQTEWRLGPGDPLRFELDVTERHSACPRGVYEGLYCSAGVKLPVGGSGEEYDGHFSLGYVPLGGADLTEAAKRHCYYRLLNMQQLMDGTAAPYLLKFSEARHVVDKECNIAKARLRQGHRTGFWVLIPDAECSGCKFLTMLQLELMKTIPALYLVSEDYVLKDNFCTYYPQLHMSLWWDGSSTRSPSVAEEEVHARFLAPMKSLRSHSARSSARSAEIQDMRRQAGMATSSFTMPEEGEGAE